MIQNKILQLSEKIFPEIDQHRRHLHQNPELSFQEYKTAEYIEQQLRQWNISYKKVANTGIIATLGKSTKTNRCIALRADIDALPIQEKNNCSYASSVPNVMHACGHDVHTACALGVIRVLKEIEHNLNGCVKIFFQPGEEVLPGGATLMIKEKALSNPKVNSVIAQHVFPDLEAGKVGFRSGPYMASTDEIYITIIGKGGHGAMPERANNPIPVASHLITEISKEFPLERMIKEHTILSFGKFIANGATNVIPEKVELAGTMRTLNPKKREQLYKFLKQITTNFSKKYKVKVQLNIVKGYPPLINNPSLTEFFKIKAIELLGKKNVVELPIRMTADDFAYYLQKVPGTYYRLGTGNKKKGITHNVHTPYFDIDENALFYGTSTMSWLIFNYLNNFNN
ncbi:MAG: amidohydrolase [Bacteroidia bacterium]|nr:MAG: amidohydrolase [Bacteroidia bacterium]